MVRDWNLSYECLSGFKARERLRNMSETDPDFWKELTTKKQDLPMQSEMVPEDVILLDDGGDDDSDLPVDLVIASIVDNSCPVGVAYRPEGGLMSVADAETLDTELEEDGRILQDLQEPKALGRGKRVKTKNRQYKAFWQHNDDQGSSDEELL